MVEFYDLGLADDSGQRKLDCTEVSRVGEGRSQCSKKLGGLKRASERSQVILLRGILILKILYAASCTLEDFTLAISQLARLLHRLSMIVFSENSADWWQRCGSAWCGSY